MSVCRICFHYRVENRKFTLQLTKKKKKKIDNTN